MVDPPSNPEIPAPTEPTRQPFHLGLLARLRAYFLAGVLVTAPVAITFYIVWLIVSFIDDRVSGFIPARYNPESYLPFGIPGLGLLIAIAALILIGAVTAGYVGRVILRVNDALLARMPVVRSIYGATKQIFETVLAHKSTAFRQVCLIEYPRREIWSIGFITGKTVGEVQDRTAEEVLNVFLPTTPNPTSGFLLFVPRRDIILLEMTIEDGIKMVISGGIVTPPETRAQRLPPTRPDLELAGK
ncbi:MAG TPA: DUF502 domain-containing protein [Alphaproteobacteria bacterium]|nr:DUF502 domain-containing protein [Alphaproteobacteria bacterium]